MQQTLLPDRFTRSPAQAGFLGAVIISFSAIMFELSGTDPVTATVFRMGYAVPLLWMLRQRQRHLDVRPLRDHLIGFASGAFLAIDIIVWQSSMAHIGAGLATLIANSQVVIVALAAWALLGERPSRNVLAAIPIVVIGLALITGLGSAETFGSRPVLGVVMSVGAAFLYSAFLMLWRLSNRRLVPSAGPLLDAVAAAAVVALLYSVATGTGDLSFTWPTHAWLLGMAIGPQVVGWLLIGRAMPRLPSAYTSFIILLQPTLTLLWGRVILDETPSLLQYSGVAIVLAGIAFATSSALKPRRV